MALSTRSDADAITRSEAMAVMSGYTIDQYFQVAVVAVLCYDAMLTFNQEVKYFWKIPRRTVDFVYFLNRYVGIVGAIAFLFWPSFTATVPLCNFAQWMQDVANWITVVSIDYILMIRVLALFSRDRTLSICLQTLLALEAVSKLGMAIYLDIVEHTAVGSFANLTFCGYDMIPSWQLGIASWMISLAYGTLLMILALYKAAEYWKISAGFRGFTLVKVLIEDQLIYFALVIACSMFAVLGFRIQLSSAFLSNVLGALGNASLLSLLGSRMLFNLKEAGERGLNEGTSYRTPSRTMSEMDFAEPVNPQRESETACGVALEDGGRHQPRQSPSLD